MPAGHGSDYFNGLKKIFKGLRHYLNGSDFKKV
jgi:hypothetical protein